MMINSKQQVSQIIGIRLPNLSSGSVSLITLVLYRYKFSLIYVEKKNYFFWIRPLDGLQPIPNTNQVPIFGKRACFWCYITREWVYLN